jgi:hypothetical protein
MAPRVLTRRPSAPGVAPFETLDRDRVGSLG